MFTGQEIAETLASLDVTHVVWLPDTALGPWETAIDADPGMQLVRICREGEAWPLAAGLYLGGARPMIVMQTTGLYESGDAMRNVLFDLKLPLPAIIGHRSYLVEGSKDTARHFAEPFLAAWGIGYVLVAKPDDKPLLAEHFTVCRNESRPGVALIAEGRM